MVRSAVSAVFALVLLVDCAHAAAPRPGFTYKVASNLQLDVHGAFGLSESAPDFFIGTGFVWRP